MWWKSAYDQFGRRYWAELIEQSGTSMAEMAKITGISRTQVYQLLRRFKLPRPRKASRKSDVSAPCLTWSEAYQEFGHLYWSSLMADTQANVTRMGLLAGIRRTDVYKSLARFDVQLPRRPSQKRGTWGDLSHPRPLQERYHDSDARRLRRLSREDLRLRPRGRP